MLQELHGPNLLGQRAGWLMSFDVNFWRPVSATYADWKAFSASFPARVERLLPDLRCSNPARPLDAWLELFAQCVDPVRFSVLPVQESSGSLPYQRSLILSCHHHALAGQALHLSRMVLRLLMKPTLASESSVGQLREAVSQLQQHIAVLRSHDFSNAVIEQAAQRGLRLEILFEGFPVFPLLQIGMGCQSRILASSCTDGDSLLGSHICGNKSYSQQVLRRLGYPVPRQVVLPISASLERIVHAAAQIGYPCVLKPCDAELGQGVAIDIRDDAALALAADRARRVAKLGFVLEEHVPGDYHRLVVIAGRLVRVARFQPPHLVGDGVRSIRSILASPASCRSAPGSVNVDGPVPRLDDAIERHLQAQGLTPESIPESGRTVVLRCDLDDRDDWVLTKLLDQVDSSIHRLAEGIAKALGMLNVGIDVLSRDITAPPESRQLWVIEVNAFQRLHPAMAALLLDQMFPHGADARIPVDVVVCAQAADWPCSAALQQMLAKRPGWALAIPRRLQGRLDPAQRATMERDRPVILYRHPREVLLNRSLEAVLFLLDCQELGKSGLPAVQVDRLTLLGQLPAAMVGPWQRLRRWVEPSHADGACCELPVG